jgi:ATP-dependent DNA ligase
MHQPIELPIKPMLAKLARDIPTGESWVFEPKWDGFRCIVARDGDELELTSRQERPITRYFPELLDPLRSALPARCVVDGEIVVPDADGRGLDFDALLQRIHPAASRVNRLSVETPAVFIAFDVLAVDAESWLGRPFRERRRELERIVTVTATPGAADQGTTVFVTPASTDRAVAAEWFSAFEGAGLDGVVAKGAGDVYQPDKRALVKVKHQRTAECVLAGFRVHKDRQGVGSMLLGLYDDDGRLNHVGVAAGFSTRFRRDLLDELRPLTDGATIDHPWGEWAEIQPGLDGSLATLSGGGDVADGQRRPGGTSRWNAGKDLSWVPVRAERVVEVTFGQLENGRFRHGVSFVRWRPDRDPASCRYSQLDVALPVPFGEFMRGGDTSHDRR